MIKRKAGALFCAVAMLLCFMAGAFMYANAADETATGTLTLWCVKDDDIVANMKWHLYRVGHREDNDYVFEGDFAGYRATLGDKSKSMLEWDTETVANAGETLKRKAVSAKIKPRDEGVTNSRGSVSFSGLEDGLYLVWGDVLIVGDTTYIPSAIFFEMTGEDTAVLNAYPKIVLRTQSSTVVNYSARKVWENDTDQPWNRSTTIVVERYLNNVYYDDITLKEENDWLYEWVGTYGQAWMVVEKEIPENYSVSYKDNGVQYLITNTYERTTDIDHGTVTRTTTSTTVTAGQTSITTTSAGQTTERQTTDVQTTEGQATSVQTTTASTTGTNGRTSTTSGGTAVTTVPTTTGKKNVTTAAAGKVPQTGQLWWPLPPMVIGGVLLLGAGMCLRKKEDEE